MGAVRFSHWSQLFNGLDDCWLALLGFCAMHALVRHDQVLREHQRRQHEAELSAREAELRALRYQLQPHFLFNTLNSISTLVAESRSDEARQTIAHLGELLRATLQTSAHEVVLAEELALTETYLAIEQLRLGDRLKVDWQIGAGTLDARVPFLLLQPLAENALRHGIALRREGGRLAIGVERQGRMLRIALRNDLPVTTVTNDSGSSVGQHNVAARLARLYPGQAEFEAGPAADGRYAVTLRMPYRTLDAAVTK